MTTYDLDDLPVTRRSSFGPIAWIGTVFAKWRAERRRQKAMQGLSELNAHLLRDIGIHWEDVHDGILGHRRSIWLNPLPRDDK